MPDAIDNTAPDDLVLTFQGGRNSRSRIADVDPREDTAGYNYTLDAGNAGLRRRPPIALVGTAPNGKQIRGMGELHFPTGARKLFVQAEDAVYDWDGRNGFAQIATVDPVSRLRGPHEHNFEIADTVLITDLEERTPVQEWNGTTWQELQHNLTGKFFARYCLVEYERAIFANVKSGIATPHLIVGSQREDYRTLSISDRPGSALGADAPWFLPISNFQPINGVAQGLNELIYSTDDHLFRLTGSDATNFAVDFWYFGSGADGAEAIVNIGNDVLFAREGVIESLESTRKFSETEADDISFKIRNLIRPVRKWQLEYNRRDQQAYCLPVNGNALAVLSKTLIGSGVSPWTEWNTRHPMSFQTQVMMTVHRPDDDRLITYMGGDNGQIFALNLEDAGDLDGGTHTIPVRRTSGQLKAQKGYIFNEEGYLEYRRFQPLDVKLTFLMQGTIDREQVNTVQLKQENVSHVYGGGSYYGGGAYYGGRNNGRNTRVKFPVPGDSETLQIQLDIEASKDFDIAELGFFFEESRERT